MSLLDALLDLALLLYRGLMMVFCVRGAIEHYRKDDLWWVSLFVTLFVYWSITLTKQVWKDQS